MKHKHFAALFLIGYLLSFDAAVRNPRAGAIAHFGSVAGIIKIIFTKEDKQEEKSI